MVEKTKTMLHKEISTYNKVMFVLRELANDLTDIVLTVHVASHRFIGRFIAIWGEGTTTVQKSPKIHKI